MSTIQQTSLVVFKKGAVLRHSELNDVVNFFEQSQLASNRYLDGVGIVRGFELSYENKTISISPGIAVFPNGILIEIKEACTFKLQTELTPLNGPIRDYFSNVFKLHNDNGANKKTEITELTGQCVLFGLENDTVGGSCFRENEVNEKRSYKPVFYLGTPLKTEQAKPTPCFAAIELPCFSGADFEGIRSEDGFYGLFVEKIQAGISSISTAINTFFDCFKPLFCNEKPLDIRNLLFDDAGLLKIAPNYAYDYLHTLIGAYNELINLPYFRQNKRRKLPEQYPNFVGLGRIPAACWGEDDCRHEWQSAIDLEEGREEAQFYARRLLELCKATNFAFQKEQALTYITSCSDTAPLSQRSIPFYADQDKIRKQWNFLATRRGLQSSIPPSQNCYIEGCDFVQVSGHIGQLARIGQDPKVDDLIFNGKSLQSLKKDLNLPFQIKLCSLPQTRAGNTMLLSEYFALHPGLKPMGGVPKGGTLLIVVTQKEEGIMVLGDFALPYYDWYQEPVVSDEKVIAQFIVESPNNFGQGVEGGMECYVFPLKESISRGPGKELLPLEVNFKSTSENATQFQWSINGKKLTAAGNSNALKHQFDFSQDKEPFELSLSVSNDKQAPVSISKKIRGIYANFELDEEFLEQWGNMIKGYEKTISHYKNEDVIKIILTLYSEVLDREILLRWNNQSLPADVFVWKLFDAEALSPTTTQKDKDRDFVFETLLQDFTGETESYVIELNALHRDTGIVDQKNILLEINFEKRGESVIAVLETTLRARHNQYRKEAVEAGETHADLVQTRAFLSLIGLFDSNDGAEDLLKAFKNTIVQLSLDKREASVPTAAYQGLLANALNFTLDKLFFMFPQGLPVATNKALDAILKDLPAKTGYELDQTALGKWNPEALSSPQYKKVMEALSKKFKP